MSRFPRNRATSSSIRTARSRGSGLTSAPSILQGKDAVFFGHDLMRFFGHFSLGGKSNRTAASAFFFHYSA